MAFKIAGSLALKGRRATRVANVILEPIMDVEVTRRTSSWVRSSAISTRAGAYQGHGNARGAQVVKAFVPLAACSVRDGPALSTQDRATYFDAV
jgi:translation elongation factor EF-G